MISSFLFQWILSFYRIIKRKNFVFFYFFSFLVFFFTFNSAGTDWDTYKDYISDPLKPLYFEPGFNILIFLFRKFESFYFLVFSICVFFIFALQSFSKKFDEIPFWLVSLTIFSCFLPLFSGALRQALALAIVLFGFSRSRPIFFFVLACLFHYSAAIFVPIYFLSVSNFSIKFKFIGSIIFFFISSFLLFKIPSIYQIAKAGDSYIIEGTTGGIKDIFIFFERLFFLIFGYFVLKSTNNTRLQTLLFPSIIGSILFIFFYTEFRNFSGRTLAILRVFDLILLFLSVEFFFKKIMQRKEIAIFAVFCYSLIKFIVTSSSLK
jgi:hypothetical protein